MQIKSILVASLCAVAVSASSSFVRRQAPPVAPPACAAKQPPARRSLNLVALSRRIAQDDLPVLAQEWQNLCLASGSKAITSPAAPCVTLAGVNGISALLANADPCAQQDNADAMVDFAKGDVNNKDALIAQAVKYRKHPRNALNINGITPSTPFCQKAPRNDELKGLVNGQLPGVNVGLFGAPNIAIFAFGGPGSCPFGQTANVGTCTCA